MSKYVITKEGKQARKIQSTFHPIHCLLDLQHFEIKVQKADNARNTFIDVITRLESKFVLCFIK